MTDLDKFLMEVNSIQARAKEEIQNRGTSIEVTALHAKYIGPKSPFSQALKQFSSGNETEADLSKHAVNKAKDVVRGFIVGRLTQLTRIQ